MNTKISRKTKIDALPPTVGGPRETTHTKRGVMAPILVEIGENGVKWCVCGCIGSDHYLACQGEFKKRPPKDSREGELVVVGRVAGFAKVGGWVCGGCRVAPLNKWGFEEVYQRGYQRKRNAMIRSAGSGAFDSQLEGEGATQRRSNQAERYIAHK